MQSDSLVLRLGLSMDFRYMIDEFFRILSQLKMEYFVSEAFL
jgi:hypothetical protein